MQTPPVSDRCDPPPSPAEWRAFWRRLLHAAGLGSVGMGILLFVAANWQAWGLAGRFGLLQAGVLACVTVALWRPPPSRAGQAALMLATLFTGALLALFGQTYQTGADTHEVFLTWALLAFPFSLAARSGATWALWWTVLDIGLALFCHGVSLNHVFWLPIDRGDSSSLMLLSCAANLAGAGVFHLLGRGPVPAAAPAWLVRLLLAIGLGWGTLASFPPVVSDGGKIVALYAALSIGMAWHGLRRRHDVFLLTVIAGSWIAISTAWLADSLRMKSAESLFLLAAWLIFSSTGSGMLLMRRLRAWRVAAAERAAR